MSAQDEHDERLAERREQRLRALGNRNPGCAAPGCEETDPFALTGVDPNIICREHLADAQGRVWLEQHHPAGRHNDSQTIPIPGNAHGALSEHQALWPEETLRNPEHSPLLRIAAWLRGWLELLRVMIDRTLGRIPPALEALDALLANYIGPGWWDTLGWDW